MLPARPLPRAAPRCSTDTCICTCAAACMRLAPHSYSRHCMRLAEADDARPIKTRRRMPHHPCALHLSSIGAIVVRLGAVGRRRVQIAQLHRRYARHSTAPDQSDMKRFTRHSDRANPARALLYLWASDAAATLAATEFSHCLHLHTGSDLPSVTLRRRARELSGHSRRPRQAEKGGALASRGCREEGQRAAASGVSPNESVRA